MIVHGTRSSYQSGCRCEDCRRANAEYMRRYNRHGAQPKGTVRLPQADVATPPADWMDYANCKGVDLDVFFPRSPVRLPVEDMRRAEEPAKAVCRACVVRDECLAYALRTRQEDGIWGGLSARERSRL